MRVPFDINLDEITRVELQVLQACKCASIRVVHAWHWPQRQQLLTCVLVGDSVLAPVQVVVPGAATSHTMPTPSAGCVHACVHACVRVCVCVCVCEGWVLVARHLEEQCCIRICRSSAAGRQVHVQGRPGTDVDGQDHHVIDKLSRCVLGDVDGDRSVVVGTAEITVRHSDAFLERLRAAGNAQKATACLSSGLKHIQVCMIET